MKAKNPHTPILIREALDIEPKVWARFEYGKEKMVPLKGRSSVLESQHEVLWTRGLWADGCYLTGLDGSAIEQKITELVK